jgi:hypothetical protein
MGKFIKNIIEKSKNFGKERLSNAKSIAGATTFMTIERRYKVFLLGVNGFITGCPSKREELAFSNLWKFPSYGIDKKYNKPARQRCKAISKHFRKEKAVKADDIKFLKEEVLPYLKSSYEKQTGNLFSTLGKMNAVELKEAFSIFKKNENELKGKIR